MRITGRSGALHCGGRAAARLIAWEFERQHGQGSVTATLSDVDDFWLEHGDRFDLLLDMGGHTAVYRHVSISVAGNAATIQIGREGDNASE